MSLILDALRKMEQDRKSRRGAQSDIRPEVLRYRGEVKPRQARPYLLAALSLVLISAGIGGGMFLKGEQAAVSPAAEAAAPAPVTSPAPGAGVSAAALSAPASPPVYASVPVRPSGSKPAGGPAAPTKAARVSAPRLPDPQPLRQGAQEHAQAPSDITISGIAYQDERRLRRAVLNDVLVGEGAEIAGARVVEIRENKVRLSRGGQLFEVELSSALSSR